MAEKSSEGGVELTTISLSEANRDGDIQSAEKQVATTISMSDAGKTLAYAHGMQLSLKDLSIQVKVARAKPKEFLQAVLSPVTTRIRCGTSETEESTLNILSDISFTLTPGSSTVVIAPPGGGATVLLRAIAGLHDAGSADMIRYNGLTRKQLKESQLDIHKLAAYCGEDDVHEPLLTVRETLAFAAACRRSDDANAAHAISVDSIIEAFELTRAADTIVGNSLYRGISGGQKRRTSLAEAFLMNPQILCLDKPTSGLDAVVARSVMEYGCRWAKDRGSVMISVLQGAGPEIISLFDNMLLLSEGCVLYFGPVSGVDAYLQSVGLQRPSYIDLADWCSEVVSDPSGAHEQTLEDTAGASEGSPASAQQLQVVTTKALAQAWSNHAASNTLPTPTPPETNAGHAVALGFWQQVALLTLRQFKLAKRNWLFVALRLANCIVMAAILGTVFLDAPENGFAQKFSLALFAVTFIAFINNAEIPMALLSRGVVYKQTNYAQYGELAYTTAVMIAHIPLTVVSDVLFAAILYYIAGYVDSPGNFFFFYLVIVCQDLAISIIYRTLSYWTPSQDLAMIAGSAITAAGLATGGYFVIRKALPRWMVWLLYISPYWWCVVGMANNEFGSDKYDADFSSLVPYRTGTLYLEAFDYPEGLEWQWGAIAFLLGLYLVAGFTLQPFVLKRVRREYQMGTQRLNEENIDDIIRARDTPGQHESAPDAVVDVAKHTAQPFPRITMIIRGVSYVVKAAGKDKQLLQGIDAVMKPGTLTALMGASGAGKTTLLDCISFRKTTGKITGDILFNGNPATKKVVLGVTAYVQQSQLLLPTATVSEAMHFSATMRLTSDVSIEAREQMISAAMELLDLKSLASRFVSTLSVAEQKLVSIAAELVSNPSVLFLDEPTTGQDASSTKVILAALRKIADSGRTIVCTIHQPSPSTFFAFDQLLLLAPGGHQVYVGPVGHHAAAVRQYIEDIPSAPKLQPFVNPAVWMLDAVNHVIEGTGTPSAGETQAAPSATSSKMSEIFEASTAYTVMKQEMETTTRASSTSHADLAAHAAQPPYFKRLMQLMRRTWKDYSRNTSYNIGRVYVATLLGLFFGCVYYNMDQSTYAGLQSAFGANLAAPGFLGVLLFTTAMPNMFRCRDLMYHESASGLYGRGAAAAALLASEIPYVGLCAVLFTSIFYFMIGYQADASHFFFFLLVTFLVALTYQYAGMMLAAVFPNIIVAQVVGGMTLAVYFLFGGVFIAPGDIIKYWRWFYFVDFESWAVRAVSMDQLYCQGPACSTLDIQTPDAVVTMTQYDFIAGQLEFHYDARWKAVGALFGFCSFYAVVTIALYKLLNHLKR